MIDLSLFVNKTVPFKFNGAELRFDLSHALFSSFNVDLGTRLLLKAVARDPVLAGARRVLDAGCGTGVIGLCVAAVFPGAEVQMRDRDTLAVAFAERNRGRNKQRLPGTSGNGGTASAPGLLAVGGDGGKYDYILSNLPAKAGGPVLAAFFHRAPSMLAPGGRLAVVVVNPLAEAALAWIAEAGLESISSERGSGHRVFILQDQAGSSESGRIYLSPARTTDNREPGLAAGPDIALSALDLTAYVRNETKFKMADLSYKALGFWGLSDFDTVGYGSALASELVGRGCTGSQVREALVVNPGVGHLAIWIARRLGPERILAAGRDILALAATGANLARLPAACRPVYGSLDALRLDELTTTSLDLIAETPDLVPEYDWIGPSWERAARLLRSGGTYVVVCPATELVRFEKRRPSGWRLLAERRRKGFAALALRKV